MSKAKKIIIIAAAVIVAAAIAAGVGIGVTKSKKAEKPETTTTAAAEKTTQASALKTSAYFTNDDINLYDDEVWNMIKKNPDRWGIAFTNSYGMSDEEKASCLKGYETGEWICCQMLITIDNTENDKPVSYTGLRIEGEGADDVYVQQNISSSFETVEAGGENQIVLNIFAHNADLTLDEIRTIVSNMNMQLIAGNEINEFPDDDSSLIPEDEITYIDVVAE